MSTHPGPRRIITIASAKGGVGKTTLAINYGLALSDYGKTVLFDFDFETGSVRSFLDMDFDRDLYHFLRKGDSLESCVVPLPKRLDPQQRYPNFGVIASPRHFMEEWTRVKRPTQHRLAGAIHRLPVDYVILDMKAGLSDEIIDAMPYSNSGILIFTPRLLAATSAAAYLVKAQLFRKLQVMFSPHSPIVEGLSYLQVSEIQALLHRADDVYDREIQNLDTVFDILQKKFGEHPVVTAMARTLGTFQVHYVLNHFTGVEESYQKAVKPFVEALTEIVSSRLKVRNLGWVQYHESIHDANCRRVPVMLGGGVSRQAAEAAKQREVLLELAELADAPRLGRRPGPAKKPALDRYLAEQLGQLEATYGRMKNRSIPEDFDYIAAASIHLMQAERPYHFGDVRILDAADLQRMILDFHRQGAAQGS
ncbi:MAG: P-loop NTPase [Acidobacteriota bacterium]